MGQRPGVLGLIAYAEDTGLGSQTKDYFDLLAPAKTMVLDRSVSGRPARPCYPERFPGSMIVQGLPTYNETEEFLKGLDVVLMAETSPTQNLLRRAKELGIKTVIVTNWEYFHNFQKPSLLLPDLLMPGTLWHFEDLPGPKAYVPYPIKTMIPEFKDHARNFVHVAGKPISPDRNGTETVLKALQYITSNVKVTIFCQDSAYIDEIITQNDIKVPQNVQLLTPTPVKNTSQLYVDQDVLLLPRRFGGLCLPVNEAIGYGLPVIMPDIKPNNQWLPSSWLIPARKIDERKMAAMIDVHEADAEALAHMIDKIRNGQALYWRMSQQVRSLQYQYSWKSLKPKYIETLFNM